ncbi:hypothetical protein [Halorhabdus rudnickae]|uniref:hypothetical protein n=1 Tax=Halorhabdus rudnickae TaxID=1775544 RepID=UPI001AEFFD1B|nr:hypothetical protein [Halorhabdus rudnickae]
MAFGKIDMNGAVVSPFFVLASGVSVGLFDLRCSGWTSPIRCFGCGSAQGEF